MCFIILVHNGQVDLTSLSFLSSDVSGNIAEVWVVGCVLVAGSGTQHFVSWNYDMATVVLRWLVTVQGNIRSLLPPVPQ